MRSLTALKGSCLPFNAVRDFKFNRMIQQYKVDVNGCIRVKDKWMKLTQYYTTARVLILTKLHKEFDRIIVFLFYQLQHLHQFSFLKMLELVIQKYNVDIPINYNYINIFVKIIIFKLVLYIFIF